MIDRRWNELATLAGVPFALLLLAGAVVGGAASQPAGDAPNTVLVSWFVEHGSAMAWSGYLTGLAAAFFLWFIGGLRAVLRAVEGASSALSTVAVAAGVMLLAVWTGQAAAWVAASVKVAGDGDASVVRALFDLGNVFFAFGNFPAAALVGATSLVAHRSGLLPTVLTWGGLILVIMLLVGAMPMGLVALVGLLATGLFIVVWVPAISVTLTLRSPCRFARDERRPSASASSRGGRPRPA